MRYYSADLSISIVEIKAENAGQAEAIIQEFVDKIALIMKDKISWDEADWTVQENTLNETEGVWEVKE